MKMANITLDEQELREAVILKMKDMGLTVDNPGQLMESIEFTAGRGKNGFSASVSIGNTTRTVEEVQDTQEEETGEQEEEEQTTSSEETSDSDDESEEDDEGESSSSVFGKPAKE